MTDDDARNGTTAFHRIRFLALAIMLPPALSASPPARAAEAVLAAGGKALMPVVVHAEAGTREREIAAELAGYLQRMSGAAFKVTAGDGKTGIVVGTIGQFPVADWAGPPAVRGRDGVEAFGVRSGPGRVLVLGATDRGLDHAVTRLLETLGCRWFFPGKAWHVIPERRRLAVDLDCTDRPALLSRVIWWNWGHWDARSRRDWRRWTRRNYLGESLKIRCGHAWGAIIRQYRDRFEKHPEYLALQVERDPKTGAVVSKKRGGNKFCIANPGVVALCREYALEYFAKNPDADMVSMEPSDGGGHCRCGKCRAMGPVSRRVHYLTNEVAKAVADRFPGKFVGTYAYNVHSEPPDFVMAPNVYVQVTAGFTRGRYTFLELIDEWHKHARQLGVYEYLNVWAWSRDMPGASRGADTAYLAERIPYYAARGCTTMSCESGSNYGPDGLGYLVASRLMWDPETDPAAVCADFYNTAFGPAAGPMRRYYERFDGGSDPLVSDHLLALACRDLAAAARLAAGRPAVLRRLDDLKLYLRYVEIMRRLGTPQEKEARLETVGKLLRFAYRTRHRYIVHSTGIRGRYATYYLRGIEQPAAWDWRKRGTKTAWYAGDPHTPAEVAEIFAGLCERYRPLSFQTRTFSDALVPAGAAPMAGTPRARQVFQGSRRFIFRAGAGPLRFRLRTGVIAHYRDRRPTAWKITDPAGKTLAAGELPLDGKWHPVSAAAGGGPRELTVDDFGAGWEIDYAPGTPAVWALEKGRRIYGLGGSTAAVYFYVPRGTKRVAYYVEGTAHAVLDAAGKEAAAVDALPGDVVTVDVPAGRDGAAWCLRGLKFRRLWFYNCPNYLAALAEELLRPRDADGG